MLTYYLLIVGKIFYNASVLWGNLWQTFESCHVSRVNNSLQLDEFLCLWNSHNAKGKFIMAQNVGWIMASKGVDTYLRVIVTGSATGYSLSSSNNSHCYKLLCRPSLRLRGREREWRICNGKWFQSTLTHNVFINGLVHAINFGGVMSLPAWLLN